MRKKETKCGLIGSEDHTLSFTSKKEKKKKDNKCLQPPIHASITHTCKEDEEEEEVGISLPQGRVRRLRARSMGQLRFGTRPCLPSRSACHSTPEKYVVVKRGEGRDGDREDGSA